MESRELRESKQTNYFISANKPDDTTEGTRDMYPLYPFVISGGKNTERYYFIHVSKLSDKYRFNVRPEYFGDESAYVEVFPKRISEILSKNADAKIMCVFDIDTVVKDNLQDKHEKFVNSLKPRIEKGQIVLCESMPSFEFWLLLHFNDYKGLLKDYPSVSKVLAPHIKPYFKDSNTVRFKKLIKCEKYLKDQDWVKRLLDEGRLEQAVERAKICLAREMSEKGSNSYTNVFKAFE